MIRSQQKKVNLPSSSSKNHTESRKMKNSSSFLLLISLLVLFLSPKSAAGGRRELEWGSLTKTNFTSQIRAHNHILLLVTVPWCGESRSIAKELSHMVAYREKEFGYLKLMVLYRNSEKILANAIGASEGISLFYFHHSTSYKYNGRLRSQNILSSIYNFLLLHNEEIPLKPLKTLHDIENLFQSTDKAVVLVEFCGWSRKLLHRRNYEVNGRTKSFENQSETVGLFKENLSRDGEEVAYESTENQKDSKSEELACDIKNGHIDTPFFSGYVWVNHSDDADMSCTAEQFQKFKNFFSEFLKIAREYFLPFEKHRFGLISDRSVLQFLNVGNIDSWSTVLHLSGFDNPVVVNEGVDLRAILHTHDTLLKEIDYSDSLGSTTPPNQPSLILFIDRSSESSKLRGESNSALQILRKFVKDNGLSSTPNQIILRHPHHKTIDHLSPHLDKFKDNTAFMVLNKGQMVSLDAISGDQGASIQNILATLLQQRKSLTQAKETTISLLAKKVGFELLSEDFKVQIVDSLPSQFKSSQLYVDGSVIGNDYNHVSSTDDNDQNQGSGSYCKSNTNSLQSIITKELGDYMQSFTCPIQEISNSEKEYPIIKMPTEDSDIKDIYTDDTTEIISFPKTRNSFQGSFFFSDGNYKLLRSLTGGSKIPLLVILDPVSQSHYVCEDTDINNSSLSNFLESYMNGTLAPYQLSVSSVIKPRQYPRPPFVNHDFHEADSIPLVTINTFCEMIIGYKPCELGNKLTNSQVMNDILTWKKDVLVLFTTSWCGFCQRMELIVREVHRAIRHFSTLLDDESDSNSKYFHDHARDSSVNELPSIFLMDCTLNDCGTLLKPVSKEIYPKLMLFPAENKTAVIYEGDMSVASIFEFLMSSGRNSGYLNRQKGILWTPSWKGSNSHTPMHDKTIQINEVETLHTKEREDTIPITRNLEYRDYHIMPGSILTATDKLINTATFNNATILIVKADTNQGFQGLIINKPINWDIFKQLGSELEALKRASLFYGGPVTAQDFPLVSLTRKEFEGYAKVVDNLYFGGPLATGLAVGRIKSGDAMAEDFRFYVGYSSWGWEQLFEELEGGAWSASESNIGRLDLPLEMFS